MGQERTIQLLHDWLLQNRWSHCLEVKCDHTESGEELALFAGPKERGKGRGCRVAETDILAFREDSRTVDLIVEVDLRPNPTPKRAISNLLPVLIADNYTPSYLFRSYKFDQTLVVYLFLLDVANRSQKKAQFELIGQRIRHQFDLPALGIRDFRLCYGRTEDEAVASFQRTVQSYFTCVPPLAQGTSSPLPVVASVSPQTT